MIVGLMQNSKALKKLSEKWNVLSFEKVLKDSSGGNIKIKSKDVLGEGLLPVIDQSKSYIAGYTNENAKVKAKVPLIVFGDHTRIFKYIDFEFAMGADGTKLLEVINENALPKFVYYYLTSIKIVDTGYNRHFKYVKDLKIPLPPLETQKEIVSILDNAAALKEKTQKILQEYDALAKAIFLDMFGSPITNPKSFTTKRIGDLGRWQSGGTPKRSKTEYYVGNIPWLSSGELNKMYVSDSKEHINESSIKESSAKLIPPESLLLGMYDTAALKSSITTREMSCNQAIAFGTLDAKLANVVYIYSIIQLSKEYYRRKQRGARQKNLNLSMVKGIEILYPPIELQNEFAEKIALIEKQKALANQELKESEDLFNCLLQKAFKGELV